MAELRWILLGLGVAFCVGLWWWETRRRGRRAQPVLNTELWDASEPVHRFDDEPDADPVLEAPDEPHEGYEFDEEPFSASARIEPTFDGTPSMADSDSDSDRVAPTLSSDNSPAAQAQSTPLAEPKIISLRLVSQPETPFIGRELREALQDAGLQHGKFSIFHRHADDESDAPVFSVASLTEPGSFDLLAMDRQTFRGVTFFALVEEAGEEGIADMRQTAQDIASRLHGLLSTSR